MAALDGAVVDLAHAPRGSSYESFRDYYEADRRFHHAVVVGTGNRFLVQSYEALGGQFQRFRLFSGRGVTDADATIAEHRAIRDAIADGRCGCRRGRDARSSGRREDPVAERTRRRVLTPRHERLSDRLIVYRARYVISGGTPDGSHRRDVADRGLAASVPPDAPAGAERDSAAGGAVGPRLPSR